MTAAAAAPAPATSGVSAEQLRAGQGLRVRELERRQTEQEAAKADRARHRRNVGFGHHGVALRRGGAGDGAGDPFFYFIIPYLHENWSHEL